MAYFFSTIFLLLSFSLTSNDETPSISFKVIPVREIYSKLSQRKNDDRVNSGQIKSKDGLSAFESQYQVEIKNELINYDKQMIIFGITDNIHTRAHQFLKQESKIRFILDYAMSDIEYKIGSPKEGNKHCYIQIFIVEKIEGIPQIVVRNILEDSLSVVYK